MLISFDYTKAAFRKIGRHLDLAKWVFDYGVHIVMIVYLAFAMVMGNGGLLINAALMGVSITTLIFTIIYSRKDLSKKERKQAKKQLKEVKKGLRIGSLVIKGVSFVTVLYGMYTSANTVTPINIILTTLLLIVWIISVMVELAGWLFEKEKDYILTGLKYDITLGEERDSFANLIGKHNEKDKIILELEELVEEEREDKLKKVKAGIDSVVEGVRNIFKGA